MKWDKEVREQLPLLWVENPEDPVQEQMEPLEHARDILWNMLQQSEATSHPHKLEEQWRSMHRRAVYALTVLDNRRRGDSILDDKTNKEANTKELKAQQNTMQLNQSMHAPTPNQLEQQKKEPQTEHKEGTQPDDEEMKDAKQDFTDFMYDYITCNVSKF